MSLCVGSGTEFLLWLGEEGEGKGGGRKGRGVLCGAFNHPVKLFCLKYMYIILNKIGNCYFKCTKILPDSNVLSIRFSLFIQKCEHILWWNYQVLVWWCIFWELQGWDERTFDKNNVVVHRRIENKGLFWGAKCWRGGFVSAKPFTAGVPNIFGFKALSDAIWALSGIRLSNLLFPNPTLFIFLLEPFSFFIFHWICNFLKFGLYIFSASD